MAGEGSRGLSHSCVLAQVALNLVAGRDLVALYSILPANMVLDMLFTLCVCMLAYLDFNHVAYLVYDK